MSFVGGLFDPAVVWRVSETVVVVAEKRGGLVPSSLTD